MRATGSNSVELFGRMYATADRAIAWALAAVLLVAAVLKAIRRESPLPFPLALETIVVVEIAGAFLLLLQRTQPTCRLFVAILFAVFATFASSAALRGEASCGCFGNAEVGSVWILFLDAFACV